MLNTLEIAQSAGNIIVPALVNSLWLGIVLTSLFWLLLRLNRRLNATTRYAVWWLPLLVTFFIPAVITIRSATSQRPQSDHGSVDSGTNHSERDSNTPRNVTDKSIETSELPSPSTQHEQRIPKLAPTESPLLGILSGRWAAILFLGWLLGMCLMLARLAKSFRYAMRSASGSQPDPAIQASLEYWLKAFALRRKVSLTFSKDATIPQVTGLLRPAIVIPEQLVASLTPRDLDRIIVHELAHIERRDDWFNLAQRLIESILFFHPAVWWISRQLVHEREIACDDRVVARMGEAKSYANCLLKLVENLNTPRSTLVVPIAAITRRHLSVRIEEILKRRMVMPDVRISRVAFLLAISLSALAVITALKTPPVIAIDHQSAPVSNQTTEASPVSSPDTSAIHPVPVGPSKQTTPVETRKPDIVLSALSTASRQQLNSGSEETNPLTTVPKVVQQPSPETVVSYPQSWDSNLARNEQISQRVQLSPGARVEISTIAGPVIIQTTDSDIADIQITRMGQTQADLDCYKTVVEHTPAKLAIRHEQYCPNVRDHQTVKLTLPRSVNLALNTIAGRVHIGPITGSLRLEAIAGEVSLARVHSARISSLARGLSIGIGQPRGQGIEISAIVGGVDFKVAADVDASLNVGNLIGEIENEATDVSVTQTGQSHFQVIIGSGGTPISVSAIRGGIKIQRS